MNYAKAIERAFAATIRQYATGIGAKTTIRPWQSLRDDPLFRGADKDADLYGDRWFPLIDIRTGPPTTDDHITLVSATAIQVGTLPTQDRDHARISDMYTGVSTVLEALRKQHITGSDGDEMTLFKATLAADLGEDFHFGGVSFGDGAPPADAGGYNVMTLAMNVHHSRTDY